MPPLSTDLFDYDLPPRLIAQVPSTRRDQSRLLVVDRATRRVEHTVFAELPRFLRAGDTLFRNNAAVLPARLRARRPSGGAAECFLLRPVETRLPGGEVGCALAAQRGAASAPPTSETGGGEIWRCLVKPGKKLSVGATFASPDGEFTGEILAKDADGTVLVRFATPDGGPITAVANRLGEVPLPPYIERADGARRAADLERYQTVYADRARQVAVAAPTAGLHFTPEMLATLAAQGVGAAEVTLHVGLGTFKPITATTVEGHVIHRERCELPVVTQHALLAPPGRRVAVGTTSVRAAENFLTGHTQPLAEPHVAEAGIFIYPPFTFRGTDALITNFHQPRSTLLCLVAAFLAPDTTDGIAWLREIYGDAIAREYRFFSYGDAMLIL